MFHRNPSTFFLKLMSRYIVSLAKMFQGRMMTFIWGFSSHRATLTLFFLVFLRQSNKEWTTGILAIFLSTQISDINRDRWAFAVKLFVMFSPNSQSRERSFFMYILSERIKIRNISLIKCNQLKPHHRCVDINQISHINKQIHFKQNV